MGEKQKPRTGIISRKKSEVERLRKQREDAEKGLQPQERDVVLLPEAEGLGSFEEKQTNADPSPAQSNSSKAKQRPPKIDKDFENS